MNVVVVMMMMMMLVINSNALIFLVEYKIHNALKMIAQKQQTGYRISKMAVCQWELSFYYVQ